MEFDYLKVTMLEFVIGDCSEKQKIDDVDDVRGGRLYCHVQIFQCVEQLYAINLKQKETKSDQDVVKH